MSKSNWKGSAGWGAGEDFTNILENNVLELVPGKGTNDKDIAFAEDYVLQQFGTSTGLTYTNIGIRFNYAWDTVSGTTLSEFGGVVRAHNFTSGTTFAAIAANAYIGSINLQTKSASIVKRQNLSAVTINTKYIGNSFFNKGCVNTFEVKCYGENTPTIDIIINRNTVLTVRDDSASPFNEGYPGLTCSSGSVYVTSVILLEYTSDGSEP